MQVFTDLTGGGVGGDLNLAKIWALWGGPKNSDFRFSVTRKTVLPIRIILRLCAGVCGQFAKLP